MSAITYIDETFIEQNSNFNDLVKALEHSFSNQDIIVPLRHHHDFPNPKVNTDSTLLLMPAWNPSKNAGIKVVTVNPENAQFNLPSIQGVYLYFDAANGTIKAIFDAKNLTVKRTAAASALASQYLSKTDSSSLLMIGTGALSTNLIKAHASVRPIKNVFVWGRDFNKAQDIATKLNNEHYSIHAIHDIKEKIAEVDIISCATLSKTPLVLGKYINDGQHIDLVGSYRKDTREADDTLITKASVFVDTFQGGLKESGDIVIPIQKGILKEDAIKADLFSLTTSKDKGRKNDKEITVFKSVGHALEDLSAATYYFNKFNNE